jgi:dipeptidyl aminopeptidase/acylaminoacyl peptidase
MKKAFLLSAVCIGAAVSLAALTPEETLDRRGIGDIEFSPDGARVAFTVTEPPKGASRARSIWLFDLAAGQSRQLTFSGKSDSAGRWSPDGESIGFLSDRDGPAQLYRLSMRGGEAEKLTDRKEAITAFRWSPDGRRIALLMPEAKPEERQKRERDKDDGKVIDKDDRHPRVWILDVASRSMRQVTSGTWLISQIEWTPSGDRLIASATAKPEEEAFNHHLFSIDLGDGRFDQIAAPRGPLGAFAVSPDGRSIAFVGARVDGPEAHDLYVMPIAGGTPQNLTATTIDRPIAQPHWVDNQSIAVHVSRGFTSSVSIVGPTARPQTLDPLVVNPSAFARSTRGTLAYAGETATRAPELWVKPLNGGPRAVTTLNEKWSRIAVVAPEFVKYKSFDGVDIEAALLNPRSLPGSVPLPRPNLEGATAGKPFVVLVHGGPTGRWADTFEPWGQLLAARGYAVLYPNIRGSVGYGETFVEMNRGDWGGGDFKDVMAGVDWAIARGIADPTRLGIGGWSYGGYMAAWAVTQTTRFRASVSGAPVIDMASEFGTENGSAYDEWFYGTPYEKLDGFIKSSPMTFVKNVKTPTLLLQGEADTTDPIGQSQQFYRGLKRYGVDSDFVVYPREPHGLREEKHLLDRLNRIVAWYDKYLKPNASSTAPQ